VKSFKYIGGNGCINIFKIPDFRDYIGHIWAAAPDLTAKLLQTAFYQHDT